MSTDAGIKHDQGKPRVSLVVHGFARALLEVSAVATFGAEKYSAHGWVSVPHGCERYTDAMYRHLLAEAAGQQSMQSLAWPTLRTRPGARWPGWRSCCGTKRRGNADDCATNRPAATAGATGRGV